MAFCVACGSELKESNSFCGKCGCKTPDERTKTRHSVADMTLSLESFSENREKHRQTFFKTKKEIPSCTTTPSPFSRASNAGRSAPPSKRSVVISVGMARREFGDMKAVRGKRLPLKIMESSTTTEILLSAIEKQADHNQEFCGLEEWV